MKLWQKDKKLNEQIEAFTVGDDPVLDLRLIKYDCIASKAHARMLGKIGILTNQEVHKLTDGLDEIIQLREKGQFTITREQEDCHTAIENHLTEKLGELGKKIHTARSRNDQVLTAVRLYLRDAIEEIIICIEDLIQSIETLVKSSGQVQYPGLTHTRKAMVSTIEMWASGYGESMQDNILLLKSVGTLLNQSPLGTGAGYGIPLEIDREITKSELAFDKVQKSPIYVQLSRGKFESTLIHVLGQIMLDLNRMSSDLIMMSMSDFGYFKLPDEFCTGSSIMPQKKNPDVLELIRAKYHGIAAKEVEIKGIVANLISGYHRDLQLTKRPILEALDTTESCLSIMSLIVQNLIVDKASCQKALTDEVYATEKVYALVQKGIPFREAYQQIAREFS